MIDPLQESAVDEREIRFAERKERDRRRRRGAVVRQQLSTYDGREFVWQELEAAGVFEDITGDALEQARALGRRAQGLRLLKELQDYHGEAFLLMQREAIARGMKERQEIEAFRQSLTSGAGDADTAK